MKSHFYKLKLVQDASEALAGRYNFGDFNFLEFTHEFNDKERTENQHDTFIECVEAVDHQTLRVIVECPDEAVEGFKKNFGKEFKHFFNLPVGPNLFEFAHEKTVQEEEE